MGTEKRERQKANRQLKLEQIAKEQAKQQTKRRGLQIGLIVGAVVLLVAAVYFLSNRGDKTTETQAAGAVTTIAGDVQITLDPNESATTLAGDAPITIDPNESASSLPAVEAPAPTVPGATVTGDTECPEADGSSARTIAFEKAPPMCIDAAKKYTAKVVTNVGELTIELDAKAAPKTVNNFVTLARYHYFDGITCHRAIPDFMTQCGDPDGTGSGGPGYEFEDELPASVDAYKAGSLAMANAGANTNGSQFFIVSSDNGGKSLGSPNYSLFGQVTEGLDTTVKALDALGNPAANGVPPLGLIQIISVTITEA